jgi:acyl carrier protein
MREDESQHLARTCLTIQRVLALPVVEPATPLVSSGVLDSLSLVNLVLELQRVFGVSIPDDCMVPEQFETPVAIARMCADLSRYPLAQTGQVKIASGIATFMEQLQAEVSRARRHKHGLAILLIGVAPSRPAAGADVLDAILACCRAVCRKEDQGFVIAEPESPDGAVAIILPATDRAGAIMLVERLGAAFASTAAANRARIGVAAHDVEASSAPELIAEAIRSLKGVRDAKPRR